MWFSVCILQEDSFQTSSHYILAAMLTMLLPHVVELWVVNPFDRAFGMLYKFLMFNLFVRYMTYKQRKWRRGEGN